MTPNYDILPEHMREGARLWIERGIATGSFWCSVIDNKLVESFANADEINSARMRDIVRFLYDETPSGCWGSPAKTKAWREHGGQSFTEREPKKEGRS